ncbi:MAG: cytochrome c family protein [Planctomycetaceae bacterium]|nr:cytochrome c family protein [Planctomycetaceae bacterium]
MNALPEQIPDRNRRLALISLTLASVVVASLMFIGLYLGLFLPAAGPEQQISFSHHVHAGNKQISCFVCHGGAQDTAHADIPPLETCMLCHEHVIITHPQIRCIRQQYANNTAMPWKRVTNLPEFVKFNHQVHLQRGVDCGRCHGDVKSMDRLYMPWDLKMGFCIQCHRDNKATTDCMNCHH